MWSFTTVLYSGFLIKTVAAKELTWKQERIRDYVNYTFVTIAAATCVALLWRAVSTFARYRRRSEPCIDQATTGTASAIVSAFKKHVLYAPIIRSRKARNIIVGPGASVNLGMLPTRLEALFIATYFIINMVFIFVDIDYTASKGVYLYAIRNRAGAVLTANLIPLFLFASRNNPLIHLLDLSFDKFNLLHRWLGRIVTIDLLIHVFVYIAGAYAKGQDTQLINKFTTQELYIWALVAGCPMLLMAFLAWSPIRRPFYDTFLQVHRVLAIVSLIGIWRHINSESYYEIKIVFAVVAIWIAERAIRVLRLLYRNLDKSPSPAVVEILPGDAMRVTVRLARPWRFSPGQHAYLYMPGVSLISSHPFSAAWCGSSDEVILESGDSTRTGEKTPEVTTRVPESHTGLSTICFVLRVREGFTRTLWERVCKESDASNRFTTACFLEGPYGNTANAMDSYSSVVLFAGGIGITHQLPYAQYLAGTTGGSARVTKRMLLVWLVHSPSHTSWAADWLNEILARPGAQDVLRVQVFVSNPDFEGKGGRMILPGLTENEAVKVFAGRPSAATILDAELTERKSGHMGVSVCGPGGLSDDVRFAVRQRQHLGAIDYIEASFSW